MALEALDVAMLAEDARRARGPLLLGSTYGALADRLDKAPGLPGWAPAGAASGPANAASNPDPAAPVARANTLSTRIAGAARPTVVARKQPAPSDAQRESPASPLVPRSLPVPPSRKRPLSALADATRRATAHAAQTFKMGDPRMSFSAPADFLSAAAGSLSEGGLAGINSNTATMDERAWEMWEHVCRAYGTNPVRTASDARDFPERNSHLLAALLMHAFSNCQPRTKGAQFIKPRSALAYPLAIIRVHSRWGVHLPPAKALKPALHSLSRQYISVHGQYSLAPKRAEPIRFSMVLDMHRLPEGVQVGHLRWSDSVHDVFIFRRLSPFLFETAHRLAEIVGPTDYLTFASLVWVIAGTVRVSPTAQQLRSLQPGSDYALVSPPRSKSDQFGEIHCSFPTALLFHNEPANAALGLRDLELRVAPAPEDRAATPLFADAQGAPYTHAFLDRLLKAVLAAAFGEAAARVFTWHSYRVGLATSLYAAGVPDAEIQLYCRWMCLDSLRLMYRRIGAQQRDAAVRHARRSHVHSLQTPNAVRVADAAGYARPTAEPSPSQLRHFALERAAVVRAARAAPLLPARRQSAVPPVMGDEAYAAVVRAVRDLPDSSFVDGAHSSPAARRRPSDAAQRSSAASLAVAPSRLWPQFPCDELGGRGWLVEVVSRCGPTSLVRFVHARDASGRPFLPVRLNSADLQPPPPTGT